MGYPMSYDRVIHRNSLLGDYRGDGTQHGMVAGDLRRLEKDQQDERHVAAYAKLSGVSKPRVRRLLALFFESGEVGCAVAEAMYVEYCREHHITPTVPR